MGQAAATSRRVSSSTVEASTSSGLRKSPFSPLESGRCEHDAGPGADAAPPVDDHPHCHVTPALIAYWIASVSVAHTELGQEVVDTRSCRSDDPETTSTEQGQVGLGQLRSAIVLVAASDSLGSNPTILADLGDHRGGKPLVPDLGVADGHAQDRRGRR